MFWLMLRRYGGYPLHEAFQDKPWRLVGEKLLPGDKGEQYERAFRVLEVELYFLYDFFYTKNYATHALARFRTSMKHKLCLFSVSWWRLWNFMYFQNVMDLVK
ncbi:hypothetical protein Droror1_Dr00020685 [Drosera rotundifolia]